MGDPSHGLVWFFDRSSIWLAASGLAVIGAIVYALDLNPSIRDLLAAVFWTASVSVLLPSMIEKRELDRLQARLAILEGVERGLRETEATATILEHISSPLMRERRRRVNEHRAKLKEPATAPRDLVNDLEEILVAYDRLGFLVHDSPELSRQFLGWLGESILAYWEIGEPFVKLKRSQRENGRTQYVRLLEAMANEYRAHSEYYAAVAQSMSARLEVAPRV